MATWAGFVSQVKALPVVKQRAVSAIVGAVVADSAGNCVGDGHSVILMCCHFPQLSHYSGSTTRRKLLSCWREERIRNSMNHAAIHFFFSQLVHKPCMETLLSPDYEQLLVLQVCTPDQHVLPICDWQECFTSRL